MRPMRALLYGRTLQKHSINTQHKLIESTSNALLKSPRKSSFESYRWSRKDMCPFSKRLKTLLFGFLFIGLVNSRRSASGSSPNNFRIKSIGSNNILSGKNIQLRYLVYFFHFFKTNFNILKRLCGPWFGKMRGLNHYILVKTILKTRAKQFFF